MHPSYCVDSCDMMTAASLAPEAMKAGIYYYCHRDPVLFFSCMVIGENQRQGSLLNVFICEMKCQRDTYLIQFHVRCLYTQCLKEPQYYYCALLARFWIPMFNGAVLSVFQIHS